MRSPVALGCQARALGKGGHAGRARWCFLKRLRDPASVGPLVRRVAAVELDLDQREIKVRGKGRRDRAVRIGMRPRAGLTGTCGSVRGTSRRTCLAPASRGPARTMAGVRQLKWGLRAGWS